MNFGHLTPTFITNLLFLSVKLVNFSISVFKEDFTRLRDGNFCNVSSGRSLKQFTILNTTYQGDDFHSDMAALNDCELYCSTKHKCWGCSKRCDTTCKWNALVDCEDQQSGMEQFNITISQKPGNY